MFFRKQREIEMLRQENLALMVEQRRSRARLPDVIYDKAGQMYFLAAGDLGDFEYIPTDKYPSWL